MMPTLFDKMRSNRAKQNAHAKRRAEIAEANRHLSLMAAKRMLAAHQVPGQQTWCGYFGDAGGPL